MPFMEHNVYLDTAVLEKSGLTLHQIIEAGLKALDEPYDGETFEVDCTGNEV